MSPRAAWRLESLGFSQVYDYVAGKIDWLAAGLPSVGPDAAQQRAGQVTRDDVPTCHLTDRVGDVRGRVQVSGWDSCIVVNKERVVLGRLRSEAFDGDPNRTAEAAMQIGPSTVRPNEPLDALTNRMREKGMGSVIVTTSDGRLVGILRRDDAEQRLAGQKA